MLGRTTKAVRVDEGRPMFSIDALRAHALTLGFDLCGVAPVAQVARLEYLREWVARGFAADLD
jgi:hypothetical protein